MCVYSTYACIQTCTYAYAILYSYILGRIWNERTVIVNRDSDGFGFTLANASPVSVTGTTENGSAARAGIIAGDKIIRVCLY